MVAGDVCKQNNMRRTMKATVLMTYTVIDRRYRHIDNEKWAIDLLRLNTYIDYYAPTERYLYKTYAPKERHLHSTYAPSEQL